MKQSLKQNEKQADILKRNDQSETGSSAAIAILKKEPNISPIGLGSSKADRKAQRPKTLFLSDQAFELARNRSDVLNQGQKHSEPKRDQYHTQIFGRLHRPCNVQKAND
jgi:hypothetical protein